MHDASCQDAAVFSKLKLFKIILYFPYLMRSMIHPGRVYFQIIKTIKIIVFNFIVKRYMIYCTCCQGALVFSKSELFKTGKYFPNSMRSKMHPDRVYFPNYRNYSNYLILDLVHPTRMYNI